MQMGAAKEAVVRVGPVQYLAFVEGEEALPEEYDGHHICVYLTEEGETAPPGTGMCTCREGHV